MSLFVCSLYAPRLLPGCSFPARIDANFQTIGANFRQKGAKVNKFLGVLGVFSGKSETENGKSEIYFYLEGLQVLPAWLSIWGGGGVHWLQVGRASRLQVSCGVCSVLLSLPFVRFVALSSVRCLQIWLYFAFLGGF